MRATNTCVGCNQPFDYEFQGRKRVKCDPCIKLNTEKCIKHKKAVQKAAVIARPGRNGASTITRNHTVPRAEVAHKLAAYEFWDEVVTATKAGNLDHEVAYKPLTPQAVEQIEKRALYKMRQKLGGDPELLAVLDEQREFHGKRTPRHYDTNSDLSDGHS